MRQSDAPSKESHTKIESAFQHSSTILRSVFLGATFGAISGLRRTKQLGVDANRAASRTIMLRSIRTFGIAGFLYGCSSILVPFLRNEQQPSVTSEAISGALAGGALGLLQSSQGTAVSSAIILSATAALNHALNETTTNNIQTTQQQLPIANRSSNRAFIQK
jgi:hypothetical protein